MLPTPSTSHVNYAQIYEPSEDSYLLLDTLSSPPETTFLHSLFPSPSPPPIILEIGPGSGVILAFATAHATALFGRADVCTLGIDINRHACAATATTVATTATAHRATAGVFGGVVVGDLTGAVRDGEVDVVVFNPPYVPTEEVPDADTGSSASQWERDGVLLSLSWAGGREGMEVTERLLGELPRVLSARGVAYVLLCAQNRPDAVVERVRGWEGGGRWRAEVVGRSGKQGGWERLCVVRIWRE
jgi:release factor glutamine methyltransferase